MTKYIFVTGGVVSSLGKGITAASLGHLLKARGYKVTMQKIDPYLNVDPGNMSPFQHGEVFVTEDGHEGDLDLGHYERFIDENLSRESSFTAGAIYQSLILRERSGDFLGGTVQVIPNMTNSIKERMTRIAEISAADIVITEIGGTIGDIESQPFIEAARQFKMNKPVGDVIFIHVTLVPYIASAHEVKTKPTQHSVKELRSIGVQPDFIVCRSDHEIDTKTREKISLFCDVPVEHVLACMDATSIYKVPLMLFEQGFDTKVLGELGLQVGEIELSDWSEYVNKLDTLQDSIDIAVVGKYVSLPDAYLSVMEALGHAAVFHDRKVNIHLVDGETLNPTTVASALGQMDAILVPGGFGVRAFEGKIAAVQYARENKLPFLGISLGLQAAVCEIARHMAGLEGANSAEFAAELEEEILYPIIGMMPDQAADSGQGAAMRLGSYACQIVPDTQAARAYGAGLIYERHRHRYEFNNDFREQLVAAGLVISGLSPDGALVEMIELADHPWFVACQGHPEFKSRPTRPHPLFRSFVDAAIKYHDQKELQ